MSKKILLLFLIFPIVALSNINNLRFKHLTTADGLSQATVYNMFQDSRGFMWFGSWDGLNRYDGYSFRIFKPLPNDSSTIRGIHIHSILEAKNGNLWIGTNEALNVYDYNTNKFHAFYLTANEGRSLKTQYDPIVIDSTGVIWLTYDNNKLASFNPATKRFKKYPFSDSAFDNFTIASNFTSTPETFISCGFDGIRIINIKNKTCDYYFSADKTNRLEKKLLIWEVYQDKNNTLWMATEKGLINFDTSTKKFQVYNSFNSTRVSALCALSYDGKDKLYCGSDGLGLFVFDLKQKHFISHYTKNPTNNESIAENTVVALFTDRSGNIWMNVDPQGIDMISPQYQQLNHVRLGEGDINKIYSNSVWSLTILDSINILAGFNQSGMMLYNISTGRSKIFHLKKKYKESSVYAGMLDTEKRLWLASDAGLFLSDILLTSFKKINDKDFYNASMAKFTNQIAIGCSDGVYIYNIQNDKINCDTLLHGKDISCLYASGDSLLFAGTSENKLKCFTRAGYDYNLFKEWQLDAEIKSVYYEGTNAIWVGTSQGLCQIDLWHKKSILYTEKEGLPNNYIYSVLKGNDNKLWLTTNRGISSFNKTEQQFYNYGIAEGVQSFEFNTHSYSQSPSGEIYVGGVNGFNFFKPSELKTIPFEPSLQLLNFFVNNDPIPASSLTTELNLEYFQNNIAMEFTAIDFNRNNYVNYLYKLHDNDNWTNIGNLRSLRLVNLAPGKYHLQVKVSYANNLISPHYLNYIFSISAPFYRRPWFVLLIFSIISFFIYSIYKYRIRQLLKLQEVRHRISRDLHDDVGSNLTKITMLGNLISAQSKEKLPEITLQLEKISSYARNVNSNMSEIIWAINPKQDTLNNLLSYMRFHITDFLKDTGISYEIDFNELDSDLQLIPDLKRNLFLVLKESLNNSVKYAFAKNIKVSFFIKNKRFVLIITDDGIGFDPTINIASKGGNGLINLAQRMEQVSCSFKIISTPNQGCSIEVSGLL